MVDIYNELQSFGMQVDVYDPRSNAEEALSGYGVSLIAELKVDTYDAFVIAVVHNQFNDLGESEIRKLGKITHVLYDLKYVLPMETVDLRLQLNNLITLTKI